MEPSLTGLRILRAVADRGSFTAAARELGYTQSAVSRQVATLEREVGATLFERAGGVRLTAEGLVLLRVVGLVPPDDEVGGPSAERRQHERGGEEDGPDPHGAAP